MKSIRVCWTSDADKIEELCDIFCQDRMYSVTGLMKGWYEQYWKVNDITYAHFEGQILGVLVVFGKQTGTWVIPDMRRKHIGTLLYTKHRQMNFRKPLTYYRHSIASRDFYDAMGAKVR